jgi:hypothetical protein
MKLASNLIAKSSFLAQDTARTAKQTVVRSRAEKQHNQLQAIAVQSRSTSIQARGAESTAVLDTAAATATAGAGLAATATAATATTVTSLTTVAAGAATVPGPGWIVAAVLLVVAAAFLIWASYKKSEVAEDVGAVQEEKANLDLSIEVDQQQLDDATSREEDARATAKQEFQEAIRVHLLITESESSKE